MSDLQDGKYWIQLAVDPNPLIGVGISTGPLKPIVTDGSDNVWTVKKLPDRNYTLILGEGILPLFIQYKDGNLVGSDDPPPFHWSIRGQDGGSYTIEVPSGIIPTRGWTVNNPDPKSPVTINFIEIPLPNQQWNFIPWPGPE